jgi:long-chain fatty acid transport protein
MKTGTKHRVIWGLAAVTTGFWPGLVSGTGFRVPDQDAFATGRGEAFVATADNASAIYYNPAGLTQLEGQNVRAGIYSIDLEPSYEAPSGGTFHNRNPFQVIPQLFYAAALKPEHLAVGLGIYSPFGLSVRWPQNTGFRTVATEAKLMYATINPVVAMRLLPNLSIGGGITINYANVDLQQGLVWPAQPLDRFRFRGDGWDVGFNLGALWQPHEKVFVGAAFRSATTVGLGGHTEYFNNADFPPGFVPPLVPAFPKQRVGARADFPFPLTATVGISYRPSPKWNLEFDADYGGWNRLGTVMIRQASGFPGLLPQNLPLTLDWESSWYYEFGVTRYFQNGWHLSGGYIFNENSVPDAHYPPVVADLDRHFWSVGVGRRGKRYDFDIAYQFGYGPTRTVSGSALSPAGQSADGKYEFFSHAVAVSFGVRF